MLPTLDQIKQLPFCYRTTIGPEHLDLLGHMNVRHYVGIFDEGFVVFMGQVGFDEAYHLERKLGLMALRGVISYLAEVREGESVAIYARILKRKNKRFQSMYYMVNETTGKLAATSEAIGIHVDLTLRKSVPFPPEIETRFDEVIAAHQALDWEAEVSGGIDF